MDIPIVFQDDYIVVVNKPSGLMTEPDRNNHPSLLQKLKQQLKHSLSNNYLQHLHRIDRPVSGIVLFVKDKQYLHNLSNQFAERKVVKKYLALTRNQPNLVEGELIHWHRKEHKKAVIKNEVFEYAEKVSLKYITSLNNDNYLWYIDLHTGKYHQIRAQLSFVGCPILGDSLYGDNLNFGENQIALHASYLQIQHPISNELIAFESKPNWS